VSYGEGARIRIITHRLFIHYSGRPHGLSNRLASVEQNPRGGEAKMRMWTPKQGRMRQDEADHEGWKS
jgi:hypothetical protein